MRKVASYAFEAAADEADTDELGGIVRRWLEGKGTIHEGEAAASLELTHGRFADLEMSTRTIGPSSLSQWVLTEPIRDGLFRSSIRLGRRDGTVAVGVTLQVAGPGDSVAPLKFDAKTPHVVRDLLSFNLPWELGGFPVPRRHKQLSGSPGGEELIGLLWSSSRRLPVVVVSNDRGFVLHPGIAAMIAHDLAGLAVVVEADVDASWTLTRGRSRDWSVYGGAIRLYWPKLRNNQNPFAHPLWTSRRLMAGVRDSEEAADRLRVELRRKVLGISAYTVAEPRLLGDLNRQLREHDLLRLKERAEEDSDYRPLAEELFESVHSMSEEIDHRDQQIEDLTIQVRNLSSALHYVPDRDDTGDADLELTPEVEAPPTTVEEAIERARQRGGDHLVFGADVDRGVVGLAADAGPPEKILAYLDTLHDMAQALSTGSWSVGHRLASRPGSDGVARVGEQPQLAKGTRTTYVGRWRRVADRFRPSPETERRHIPGSLRSCLLRAATGRREGDRRMGRSSPMSVCSVGSGG